MHSLRLLWIRGACALAAGSIVVLQACSEESSTTPVPTSPGDDASAGIGGQGGKGYDGENAGGSSAGTGGATNAAGAGHAGGPSAGSSTGGQGSEEVSCDPSSEDLPCYACGKQNCCTEFKALHASVDYGAFKDCLQQCLSDACMTGCVSRYAAGAEFTKYDACRVSKCPESCRAWQCVDQPNDNACSQCSNASCCSEYLSLLNAPDEPSFAECWLGCMTDSCIVGCFGTSPQAGAAYDQLDDCRTTKCAGTCQPWQCWTTSSDSDCTKCTKAACCAQHIALISSSDYADFSKCMSGCSGGQSCMDGCVSKSGEAGPAYTQLDACRTSNCDSCPL